MAYSNVSIVNLALNRLGSAPIVSLSENSPRAIAANVIYETIRNEVLEARDWVFAVTRKALAQNTEAPVNGYDYAYTLPADFLRLCIDKPDDPVVTPAWQSSDETDMIFYEEDTRLLILGYSVETLSDGTLCLMTNYDNSSDDLYIRYVREETNAGRYTAHFISALSFRLAAELSFKLTEGKSKFEVMMTLYNQALIKAAGHNQSMSYRENEVGNNDWVMAGR